jgi:hypothetical protein
MASIFWRSRESGQRHTTVRALRPRGACNQRHAFAGTEALTDQASRAPAPQQKYNQLWLAVGPRSERSHAAGAEETWLRAPRGDHRHAPTRAASFVGKKCRSRTLPGLGHGVASAHRRRFASFVLNAEVQPAAPEHGSGQVSLGQRQPTSQRSASSHSLGQYAAEGRPRPTLFVSVALRCRRFTRRPAPASLHQRAAPAGAMRIRRVAKRRARARVGGSRRAGGIALRAVACRNGVKLKQLGPAEYSLHYFDPADEDRVLARYRPPKKVLAIGRVTAVGAIVDAMLAKRIFRVELQNPSPEPRTIQRSHRASLTL